MGAFRLADPPSVEAALDGDGGVQTHSGPGVHIPLPPGPRVLAGGPSPLRAPIPVERRRPSGSQSASRSFPGVSPPPSTPGWTLMRSLDLLRRIGARVTSEQLVLDEPGERADAIVAPAATVALLKRTAAEIVEEATQLDSLVAGLPESEIRVTPASVRVGAATQLADGILDVRVALLAASMLPVEAGWASLAIALRTSDAHEFWHEATVADVLGRFRGATAEAVDRVLGQAEIERSTLWPEMPARAVARLADVLEAAASTRRR